MRIYIYILIFFITGFTNAQHLSTKKEIDKSIDKAKDYADSLQLESINQAFDIYKASKKLDYNIGMIKSLLLMAHHNYNLGKYEEVVKYASQAEQLAYEEKKPEYIAAALQHKGQGFTDLGFTEKGREIFRKALNYARDIKDQNQKNFRLGYLNAALAKNNQIGAMSKDSVLFYFQRSIDHYKRLSDSFPRKNAALSLSYVNIGDYYLKHNNSTLAAENVKKAITFNSHKNGSRLLKGYNLSILANIYNKEKKYDSSLIIYKEGLAIGNNLKNPYLLKDIYKGMSTAFREMKKEDSAQLYLRKYVRVKDSLSAVEMKSVNTPLKEILDEKNKEFSQSSRNTYLIFFGILGIALIFAVIGIKKSITAKKRYTQLIRKLQQEVTEKEKQLPAETKRTEKPKTQNPLKIPPEKEKEILEKLDLFEKNNQFTDPELSMSVLAGMLNTNPRYLSEIIKKEKDKNYNQYINELRINFIINTLYKNKQFREYKISYLATYCGFTSRVIFAAVFKSETGISPSHFIAQMKKDGL